MAGRSSHFNVIIKVVVLCSAFALHGCAAAVVTGAVVGTTVGAAKLAVKGTVGAGKLAYRGTKAVVGGTARALSSDDEEDVAP
ncbi:hypothetical protein [Ahrensia sp. R2A130]|uniref:hypothetical protein n=1 Tax=Ahrensia sp. R2A130 TaxID=744979 RepID=UPI0001E08BDC|nr:hypothetical protein [Ahrensia sp. R2A130]EFL91055.1 hypothetical protein R2A130_2724 [Ahrensia sp. R2A130]